MRRTTVSRAPQTAEKKDNLLKIGEIAHLSGIGIEALRFYERSGLLERPARSDSGYRMYDREVLERLEFIKRAQILGFSLHEIKELIAHKKAGESPCDQVRMIVRKRVSELDERMQEMRRYRAALAGTLAEWETQGSVAGHVCGLIENAEIANPIIQKNRTKDQKEKISDESGNERSERTRHSY